MNIVAIVLAVFVLLLLVWAIGNYNRMVRLRQHTRESWSDIDVELKRRYSLIPNLVSTVKGYAAHEREVFERVTELRNLALQNEGPVDGQATDETSMLFGLKRLFAVAEAYPDLKADGNFLALQKELSLTEDRIAASRRFYNANVRDLAQTCEVFPTSLLASLFSIRAPGYFELDSEVERVVPEVAL